MGQADPHADGGARHLESDVQGRYRIKPVPRKKKGNQWVAPDIAKILKESGVEMEAGGEAKAISLRMSITSSCNAGPRRAG